MGRKRGWLMGLGVVSCFLAIVLGTAWAQGKPEDSVVVYSAADSDMVNRVLISRQIYNDEKYIYIK